MGLSFIEVEHPRLREIEIVKSNFDMVHLKWLPQLTTLTFSCWVSHHDPLSFGDVPLLQTVSASNTARSRHKMLKLSEFLDKTTINNLHLNFQSEKVSDGYGLVDMMHLVFLGHAFMRLYSFIWLTDCALCRPFADLG
jgi:hypothetical protein